jgi:RimJ/RimL family protein N-acetyltransferase
MNYFHKSNQALLPYKEYDTYTIYAIDEENRTAGIEFYFDLNRSEVLYYEDIIHAALQTAFSELHMHKIYVNVVRDNFVLYKVLHTMNFITEAIHREQYGNEEKHDVIYMSVLHNEWGDGGICPRYTYNLYATK